MPIIRYNPSTTRFFRFPKSPTRTNTMICSPPPFPQCVLRVLFTALALNLWVACAPAAENASASEARLQETVTYLASDELGGRGVGTAGLDKAADYIAQQF